MKRLILVAVVVGLMFGGTSVFAGQSGKCSPEGTWYGYNTIGGLWIVTISRSGPQSYTTVMDWGPNLPMSESYGAIAAADWRGEMVKTGPKEYAWTTMSYWVYGPEGPYSLGYCPLRAEFTSCDSWQGSGDCHWYDFGNFWDDPFVGGDPIPGGSLEAFFQRMPMTYPVP